MGETSRGIQEVLRRIRGEFLEMPGLRLTCKQAERLWALDETTCVRLLEALREEIVATSRGRLGGVLIRPAARRLRTRLDPDTYGGAYLLGLRGLSVIAHGNSSAAAMANAVRLAARGVEHGVVERLRERLPDRVASARS